MADEPYTLLPQKELEDLKKQVEALKKNPLGDNVESKNLLDAVETLTQSMNSLMDIFKAAHDELRLNDKDDDLHGKFEEMSEKVDTLIDQNKKIAKGLLTVADMVKKPEDHEPKHEANPFGPPSNNPFAPPDMGPPGPPPGMPPEPNIGMNMPPPPGNLEEDHKKKGMFHFGKK